VDDFDDERDDLVEDGGTGSLMVIGLEDWI
jgi:hypothetical protein